MDNPLNVFTGAAIIFLDLMMVHLTPLYPYNVFILTFIFFYMADVLISMNRFASDYTNTFLYFGMTFDKSSAYRGYTRHRKLHLTNNV